MSIKKSNQANDYKTYEPKSNIIFSTAESCSYNPPSGPKLKYFRVPILTKNPDASQGKLILITPPVFSFGVSENKFGDDPNAKAKGYACSLCLLNKDSPSEDERAFLKCHNLIVDECIRFVVKNKSSLEFRSMDEDRLRHEYKIDPIYYKRETFTNSEGNEEQRIVPGCTPVLYPKLLHKNIKDEETGESSVQVLTKFIDNEGNSLSLENVIGCFSTMTAVLQYESIFVNSKNVKIQVKLVEAAVELIQRQQKSYLSIRPKAVEGVSEAKDSNISNLLNETSKEEEETGSLGGNSPPKTASKKAPSKVTKKRNVRVAGDGKKDEEGVSYIASTSDGL